MHKNTATGVMMLGLVSLLAGCQSPSTNVSPAAFDPTNATYSIEGTPVTLINGKATRTDSGSTTVTSALFGEPVSGDLNGDGVADAAVMLTQDTGGSGVFFYVAAAINTNKVAQGTNAILLGDRIAPQNIAVNNGQIIANFADRNPGEPMTTQPSLGVSKYFTYDGSALTEVSPMVGAGEHCGGNMMNAPRCMAGFHCQPDANSHLPFGDVGGMCVQN